MLRLPPLQHRSFSALSPAGYAHQPTGSTVPQVRAVSELEFQPPIHRSIQPRPPRSTDSPMPPVTNGEVFTILQPFGSELGVERRRKRGRPTREEAEERDRRLAAVGQTYEPKKRAPKKLRLSGTPGSLSEARIGTSPGRHTSMLQQLEHTEEGSSLRRASRQQPAEEDPIQQHSGPQSPLDDSGNERSTDAAQSPSDRLLLRSGERAQAVVAMGPNIAEAQSPSTGQDFHPDIKHESQHTGPSFT